MLLTSLVSTGCGASATISGAGGVSSSIKGSGGATSVTTSAGFSARMAGVNFFMSLAVVGCFAIAGSTA
jgi:hypothetical protein